MIEEEGIIPWLFEKCSSSYPQNSLKFTDEVTVKRVYALGRVISKILNNAGMTYWTSGGTTLGIIRHGGLIPWDDDLDICIIEKEEDMFTSLEPQFFNEGFAIKRSNSYSWKIFHRTQSSEIENRNVNYRYPFCDVFVMKLCKGKYVLKDKIGQSAWTNECYSEDQIHNINYKRFGKYQLPCPGNPEDYLTKMYGECWYSVGSTHSLDHKSVDLMQSSLFQIEEHMYKPAVPFE